MPSSAQLSTCEITQRGLTVLRSLVSVYLVCMCGRLGFRYTRHKHMKKGALALGCQVSSFRRLCLMHTGHKCIHMRTNTQKIMSSQKTRQENSARWFSVVHSSAVNIQAYASTETLTFHLFSPQSRSLSRCALVCLWNIFICSDSLLLRVYQLPDAQVCDHGIKSSNGSSGWLASHSDGLIRPLKPKRQQVWSGPGARRKIVIMHFFFLFLLIIDTLRPASLHFTIITELDWGNRICAGDWTMLWSFCAINTKLPLTVAPYWFDTCSASQQWVYLIANSSLQVWMCVAVWGWTIPLE